MGFDLIFLAGRTAYNGKVKIPHHIPFVSFFSLMIFASFANAGLIYWDGSTSTAWATGSNWVGDVPPANSTTTDIAGFNFSSSPPNAPNAGTSSINGLIIGDGSTAVPAFTLAGTNLTIGNAGIVKNAASLASIISTTLTLAADQDWINNSTTSLTMTGNIGSSGFDLTFDGSGNMGSRGIISGNGSIIKAGSGALTINGSNTYTGGTTITGGTLIVEAVGNRETLGTGALTFNGSGATLQLAENVSASIRGYILSQTGTINTSGFDLTLNGNATGAGGLIKAGAGTLELGGTNSYNGTTTVQSGTLNLVGGAAISDMGSIVMVDAAGAVFHIIDDETIGSLSGGGAFGGNVDLSGKTLILGGNDASTSYDGQWVGTNAAQLRKVGNGTLTLTNTATNDNYTGTVRIDGGTLSISAVESLGRRGTNRILYLNDGGTLGLTADMSFNTRLFRLGTANADGVAGAFDVAVGTTTYLRSIVSNNAAGAGALLKTGNGTLILEGANTYTGGTIITAGTIQAGLNGAQDTLGAGSLTFNGTDATFRVAGNIPNSTRSYFLLETGTIDTNGFDLMLNGVASGLGGVVKTGLGTLTLNRTNTYTGTTVINEGTLTVNGSSAIVDTSAVAVGAGAAFNLAASETVGSIAGAGNVMLGSNTLTAGGDNSSTTLSGIISGTGSLTKTGNGALTLSGANTYNGTTTLSAGQLNINNAAALGNSTFTIVSGTIDNTSAGAIMLNNNVQNWNGDFTFTGTNDLDMGTGAVAMNATRNVNVANGNFTVGGNISGSTFGLTKNGSGTMVLSGANTYNGTTEINGGTLAVSGGSAIADGNTVFLSNAVGVAFSINGGETIGSLQGGGAIGGNVVIGSGQTLTVAETGSNSFNGSITGSGNLIKSGVGNMTLTGTSTFNGSTTISAGKLVINGSAANSELTIGNGGTLGGIGAVGSVTVQSGGRIAPGNSPGNIAVSTLTLEGGGGYNWEIANVTGSAGTDWDLITVGGGSGAATINATSGNKFTIYISGNPTGWNTNNSSSWNIVSWGAVSGFDANAFAVDTTGFTGTAPVGTWALANTGGYLNLAYNVGNPTWNGGTGNWDSGFTPNLTGGNMSIYFVGNSTATATNNIASATVNSVASITFNSTAGAFTLNANSGSAGYDTASALALNGNIVNNSMNTQTINLALSSNATRIYDAAAGNITIGGVISGAGGLTKNGSNTLTLIGVNAYTGDTNVNSGTLVIGGAAQLNAGSYSGNISNTGDFVYASSANQMLSGIISGTGSLTKTGSGALTLSGANTYNGTTTLSAGQLNINNAAALGNSTFTIVSGTIDNTSAGAIMLNNNVQNWNGDFTFTGTNDLDMGTGAVAMNATRNVNVANGNFTVGGNISGSTFGLTKNGSGTMVLSGANTYNGTTEINDGTLAVSGGSAIIDTGTVHLANVVGVVFSVLSNETIGSLEGGGGTGGDVTIAISQTLTVAEAGSQTFAGSIGGAGGFNKSGLGTLTLNGTNSHAGGTTLNSGTLVANNASAMGVGVVTLNGGRLAAEVSLNLVVLNWSAGDIRMAPAAGTELNIAGGLTNGGAGGAFAIDCANLVPGNYTLMTFGSTNFQVADFSATFLGLDPSVHFQSNFLLNAGNLQFQILGATANGSLIQNSGGSNIPTFADFTLNGTVQTGGLSDNNTINSLIFQSGSSLRIFNTLTVTSGNLSVTGGRATITGDTLFTPGDFNKSGPGSLFVWSDLLVGGDAYIRSGLLSINHSMSVNNLFVLPGSILGGVGFIQGNISNQGTVSPGNSIGTLTIAGDYTQTSAGVLNIEIESPSSFDRVVVGGQASLAGTLNVIPYGGNNLTYGQKCDFLQAGRIVGTFDTINAPEGFRGRFINTSTVGTLLIAPDTYTRVAVTPNQERVAKVLDAFILAKGDDRGVVSTALDSLTSEEYPAAFDQIMPGFYESLANISIEQAFNQTQMLNQRISSVRLGAEGFQAMGGISQPLLYDKDGKSASEAKDASLIVESAMATNWNTWALGNGQFSRSTDLSHLLNSNTDAGGFLVGADYRWSENFVSGLYAGYEYTYSKYGSDSNMRGNGVNFGGYASYATEDGYYADAVIGGGYTGYQTRRSIQFSTIDRTAQADPNSTQFSAALNLGKDFEIGKFTLGPIVGAQYTYAGIGSFTETGAESLDLSLAQQNANSLRSTLGGRIAYTWNLNQTIAIIPEVRMLWQHEFLNNARNINASLDGGNGAAFIFETTDPYSDSVFAGAGVTAQFGKNLSGSIFYNVNFGSQTYQSNIVSAGLNVAF